LKQHASKINKCEEDGEREKEKGREKAQTCKGRGGEKKKKYE